MSLEEEGEITSSDYGNRQRRQRNARGKLRSSREEQLTSLSRHGDDETDDTDALRNDDVEVAFVRLVGVSRDKEGAAEGRRSLSATKHYQ